MTAILALTLSTALMSPAARPADSAPDARQALLTQTARGITTRPALLTQAMRLAQAPALEAAPRSRFAQPGGDSLKNGAIIGGAIAGTGMGIFVYTLCKALDDTGGEANCAGPALLYAAIAGAGGAAAGAGIDALFDGAPAMRVRVRF
ncbi:MAG: hypothetical protein WD690_10465 [Vicinamibacterales bacterium]